MSCKANPRSVFRADITRKDSQHELQGVNTELTFVRCGEFVREHRIDYVRNVYGIRSACAVVDFSFAGLVICCVACLDHIQGSSHVALGKLQ